MWNVLHGLIQYSNEAKHGISTTRCGHAKNNNNKQTQQPAVTTMKSDNHKQSQRDSKCVEVSDESGSSRWKSFNLSDLHMQKKPRRNEKDFLLMTEGGILLRGYLISWRFLDWEWFASLLCVWIILYGRKWFCCDIFSYKYPAVLSKFSALDKFKMEWKSLKVFSLKCSHFCEYLD